MKQKTRNEPETLEKRFWSKVDRRAPNECWPWIAASRSRGYGTMCWNKKRIGAHRVAWQITFGPVPKGKHVLHKCDNKLCVNPNHLFLGTHADNMADMIAKGRSADRKGESHPGVKLTETKVKEIRRLVASGLSQTAIAKKFEVTQTNVSLIVNRKGWTHVP